MPKEEKSIGQSPLLSDADSVYAKIMNDIADGVFVSGDRLVTTQLAKRYDTSINPIREALKQLQGEGFVSISPNSGASVSKFEFETMRNVFEILQLLDPYLLQYFVETYTSEQMAETQSIQDKLENMSDDELMEFRYWDTEFHWSIYKHHYNKQAIDLWKRNRLILHAMHVNLPINLIRIKQSIVEHRALLNAISNRDSDEALGVLRAHISGSGSFWSRHYRF
ncbi:GntR family transcriptional regulator [Agaribacter marinus]|uniref:GntR family transcriptional regulator n=1 Tax=Agaribacter marinus TaxID=1431249 RepID=A0AA37SWP1_9ALTE|nr:GntR family transcriptional regulator [Agaribacter marinus]GLR70537.1 GntR family transcriptional regulator [Agaribacter marinus]